jgi:hypothetical protein
VPLIEGIIEQGGWRGRTMGFPAANCRPVGGTRMNSKAPLPSWAIQRVATVLKAEGHEGGPRQTAVDLARRTGLSKSLARRCLNYLRNDHTRTIR